MVWEIPTKGNSLNDTSTCKYRKEIVWENLSMLEKRVHVNDYSGLHGKLLDNSFLLYTKY